LFIKAGNVSKSHHFGTLLSPSIANQAGHISFITALFVLVALIEAYEAKHFPEFHMERPGLAASDLAPAFWFAVPWDGQAPA